MWKGNKPEDYCIHQVVPSMSVKREETDSQSSTLSQYGRLFAIPQPVKQLFDKVPLKTYAPNLLPERRRGQRDHTVLFVFSNDEDARAGRPSFNPACLKWQVGDATPGSGGS